MLRLVLESFPSIRLRFVFDVGHSALQLIDRLNPDEGSRLILADAGVWGDEGRRFDK